MHDFCLIFLSSIYSSHFVTDIAEQGRLNSKISALQAERSGVWKGSPSGRRRAGSTPRSSSSWRQQKIWNEISTYTKWKEHNWLDGEPGRPFGPVEWSEGALPVLFTVLNFVLRLRKLTPALWSCVLSTLALTHVFSQDFQATLTQRIRNEFIYIYTIFLFVVLILTYICPKSGPTLNWHYDVEKTLLNLLPLRPGEFLHTIGGWLKKRRNHLFLIFS